MGEPYELSFPGRPPVMAPVRPLFAPWQRTLLVVPLAAALGAAWPLLGGPRWDLSLLGFAGGWGPSLLQWFVGLWVLGLAFRESVPGRSVSTPTFVSAVTVAAAAVIGGTLEAQLRSPTIVPDGKHLRFWIECVVGPAVLAAPVFAVTIVLVTRAFPMRPWMAGALGGLSAALFVDAGLRLGCSVSDPIHVVSAHVLAIALMTLGGAWLTTALDRRRWRSSPIRGS